jgi:hypothetical protein
MQALTPRQRRDAGLLRVATTTRWVAAAAIGLTATFSAAMARALPGHSGGTAGQVTSPANGGLSAGAVNGLQPAAQAPSAPAASTAPVVVSGGS